MNDEVSWRPFRHESANSALLDFFEDAARRLSDPRNPILGSYRNPPNKLAEYYRENGLRYASNQEIHAFLDSVPEANLGGSSNKTGIKKVLSKLPRIVTIEDMQRYRDSLGNPEGHIKNNKRFPIRFALFPSRSTNEYDHFLIGLVVEDRDVLKRLDSTQYTGEIKQNHFPGLLAFTFLRDYKTQSITEILEIQSDHDPRETVGLGLTEWPDMLRAASEVDARANHKQYLLAPKSSEIIRHFAASNWGMGTIIKIDRAYGIDENPPNGFSGWSEVDPAIEVSKLKDRPNVQETHFIKRLS